MQNEIYFKYKYIKYYSKYNILKKQNGGVLQSTTESSSNQINKIIKPLPITKPSPLSKPSLKPSPLSKPSLKPLPITKPSPLSKPSLKPLVKPLPIIKPLLNPILITKPLLKPLPIIKPLLKPLPIIKSLPIIKPSIPKTKPSIPIFNRQHFNSLLNTKNQSDIISQKLLHHDNLVLKGDSSTSDLAKFNLISNDKDTIPNSGSINQLMSNQCFWISLIDSLIDINTEETKRILKTINDYKIINETYNERDTLVIKLKALLNDNRISSNLYVNEDDEMFEFKGFTTWNEDAFDKYKNTFKFLTNQFNICIKLYIRNGGQYKLVFGDNCDLKPIVKIIQIGDYHYEAKKQSKKTFQPDINLVKQLSNDKRQKLIDNIYQLTSYKIFMEEAGLITKNISYQNFINIIQSNKIDMDITIINNVIKDIHNIISLPQFYKLLDINLQHFILSISDINEIIF